MRYAYILFLSHSLILLGTDALRAQAQQPNGNNEYATYQPYASQSTSYVQDTANVMAKPPLSTYSTLTGWAGQATPTVTRQQVYGSSSQATFVDPNANTNTNAAFFDASTNATPDASFALANATADATQFAHTRPSMTPDLYYSASSPEESSPSPFPYFATASSPSNPYGSSSQNQWGTEVCEPVEQSQIQYGYGYGQQGQEQVWGNANGYDGMQIQGYEGGVDVYGYGHGYEKVGQGMSGAGYGAGAYQLDAEGGWRM